MKLKTPEGYVWLCVCWNDDFGNFNGELRAIEIEEEINLIFDIFSGAEVKLNEIEEEDGRRHDFSMKFGDEFFLLKRDIIHWLGSMAWDGILLTKEDALRFVKLAGKLGFTEEEWATDSPYFKAFKEGVAEHEQARKNTV